MPGEAQEQEGGWVVKRGLDERSLLEYLAHYGVRRSQVVAVTEPTNGNFTLIYEASSGQGERHAADEATSAEARSRVPPGGLAPVRQQR